MSPPKNNNNSTATKSSRKPSRGRPRDSERRQVPELLLQSAELLLRDRSHLEITERQIATQAGVDESLIRYYFGGKDGLLLDLTLNYCDDVMEARLNQLNAFDQTTPNVTREIFQALVDAYYTNPAIARIMISESTRRESRIRSRYIERFGSFGPEGLVAKQVLQLIERLQQQGYYRQEVNAVMIMINMISLITSPLMLAPMTGELNRDLEPLRNESWIDHNTALFEARLLRPVNTD